MNLQPLDLQDPDPGSPGSLGTVHLEVSWVFLFGQTQLNDWEKKSSNMIKLLESDYFIFDILFPLIVNVV